MTPEQRAELERRGFPVTAGGMVMVCGYLVDPRSREWRAYLSNMASAAAILGIAPAGFRLVPDEVAERTAAAIRLWVNPTTHSVGRPSPELAADLADLASALSPKEVAKQ